MVFYQYQNGKKIWRQKWLKSISDLTSIGIPIESEIITNHFSDHQLFVNLANCYFDNILFGIDYNFFITRKFVSQEEYIIVSNWHRELDNYIYSLNNFGDVYILNDNIWIQIIQNGILAKQKLLSILPDFEKQFLN